MLASTDRTADNHSAKPNALARRGGSARVDFPLLLRYTGSVRRRRAGEGGTIPS